MTRRALLAASAAALAAAGCGDEDGEPPRAAEQSGGDSSLADVALLNDALAAERQAAGLLPRSEAHAAAIEREIARLRGRAQPLAEGGRPGTAVAAAEGLVALYVDVLAKLAEPRLRGLLAGMLADAAEALARERVKAGEDPAPEPFA